MRTVSTAVETLRVVKQVGQQQFDNFAKECILERTKTLDEAIHRNKLPLFDAVTQEPTKGKQQVTSLKKEVELFSRLYISCQSRDGNLEEFLRHENQACPPALLSQGNSTQEHRVTCCSAWLDMLKLSLKLLRSRLFF